MNKDSDKANRKIWTKTKEMRIEIDPIIASGNEFKIFKSDKPERKITSPNSKALIYPAEINGSTPDNIFTIARIKGYKGGWRM